ncbi:MAG: hypothetical protein AAF726_08780 [Planctomycetota bacterium]
MTLFTLSGETLDAPIQGSGLPEGARTLREVLGDDPTLMAFVRHFG